MVSIAILLWVLEMDQVKLAKIIPHHLAEATINNNQNYGTNEKNTCIKEEKKLIEVEMDNIILS